MEQTDPHTVPYFDFQTGRLVRIPINDLSPACMQAQVEGIGLVYVDVGQLAIPGPQNFRHPPFVGRFKSAIQFITEELADVSGHDYVEWENGFRCDENPEPEIGFFIRAALALRRLTADLGLDTKGRTDAYRVICVCMGGPRESVPVRLGKLDLPEESIEKVVDLWYNADLSAQ